MKIIWSLFGTYLHMPPHKFPDQHYFTTLHLALHQILYFCLCIHSFIYVFTYLFIVQYISIKISLFH